MSSPTFVDLQVNGHGGIDFLTAKSEDEIRAATQSLFNHGVQAFLPTLITADVGMVRGAAGLIEDVARQPRAGEAEILGLHLEGPFISHEKCGVHPQHYITSPTIEKAKELLAFGNIKVVTIAPEVPGALDVIRFLVDQGIVVSLGHSNATADQAHAGFDCGASTVTHLFNAMSKFPGLVSAALERDDVMLQIIVDDIHLSRENLTLALNGNLDRFIVISDSVAPAGLANGSYNFGEMQIEVTKDGARRVDGTLAGGIGTLQQSLEILQSIGVEESAALASVTTRPLTLLNL